MAILGILLTFPYGYLSDRVGRKLVVFLSLLGQILEMFATIGIREHNCILIAAGTRQLSTYSVLSPYVFDKHGPSHTNLPHYRWRQSRLGRKSKLNRRGYCPA